MHGPGDFRVFFYGQRRTLLNSLHSSKWIIAAQSSIFLGTLDCWKVVGH